MVWGAAVARMGAETKALVAEWCSCARVVSEVYLTKLPPHTAEAQRRVLRKNSATPAATIMIRSQGAFSNASIANKGANKSTTPRNTLPRASASQSGSEVSLKRSASSA